MSRERRPVRNRQTREGRRYPYSQPTCFVRIPYLAVMKSSVLANRKRPTLPPHAFFEVPSAAQQNRWRLMHPPDGTLRQNP